jgi:hypothetical protein
MLRLKQYIVTSPNGRPSPVDAVVPAAGTQSPLYLRLAQLHDHTKRNTSTAARGNESENGETREGGESKRSGNQMLTTGSECEAGAERAAEVVTTELELKQVPVG